MAENVSVAVVLACQQGWLATKSLGADDAAVRAKLKSLMWAPKACDSHADKPSLITTSTAGPPGRKLGRTKSDAGGLLGGHPIDD